MAPMALCCVSSVMAELVVSDGYVRGLPPGQANTAAFMTLGNAGDKPLRIIAVKTDAAAAAEIHESSNSNGMMRMQRLDELELEAGASVKLQPGGKHLMLLGLRQVLAEGNTVTLQFQLSSGQQFEASMPVRSVLTEHHHHH